MTAAGNTQFRRLAVLMATTCIDMLGFAMVLPLLPYYALRLHATPEQIGLIISSFSIAQLVFAPIWGRVSDHYGRRPVIIVGLTAAAIAYVVFGFANTVWLLFASRIIQGAGGGTTAVAQAYVADTIEPGDRAKALGWLSASTSVGVMLGPVIGSLAAHWGQEAPGIIAAALNLANAGFAWRWLPEPPRHMTKALKRPIWHAAWEVVRYPRSRVPRLIWIYAAGMLGFSAMTSILSLYLDAEFGITEKSIGYVFLYVGALSLVMRSLVLGPFVRRFGETGAMRLGTLLLMTGLLLYPAPQSLWALALVIPFVPVGTALLFPATTALMSRASDRAELGAIMGVAQTFAGLSRVLAPLLATSAFQRFGHASPFYVAGAVVAVVGILAFRITPVPRPQAEGA